ncbi:MAG: class I SAM-dependent methyltransferase [Candidatus Thorarchaeota archaeon]
MTGPEKFFEANRAIWDRFAKINYDSETYRVKEFLKGKTSLNSIELEEVGDVKGKSLLHLQCHFGLDTLSWAREGAVVTGVDFSGDAIQLARNLAEESGLEANFIQSNIYDLPDVLDEKFDIVFTSYGVHCWLNDLPRWGEIVAHYVKPGGMFYIAEFHPLLWTFDWDAKDDFKIVRGYFHNSSPCEFEVEGSYADGEAKFDTQPDYEWAHTLADAVNAIISAGLRIEFLNEHAKTPFQSFSFLKQMDDGYWYYDNPDVQLPLVFSIRATKTD